MGHQDGSATLTSSADGSSIFFDTSGDVNDYDMSFFTPKLDTRTEEIVEFRKELAAMTPDSDLYKQIFGDEVIDAQLNMDKFSVSGHSFGGVTAISAAKMLTSTECHACLTMDPWMSPMQDELDASEFTSFDVDVQVLVTGSWYYD